MNDDPSRFRDRFGNQGLPQDCFETCRKPQFFAEGCERLKRDQEEERKARVLRAARAS